MIVPRSPLPLQLTGLTKSYPKHTALQDVDLRVEPGEVFALLGPNGAGKTTLISLVCGLARPTRGEISVFGYDAVVDFRQTRRLIGLVPQEIGFDPFFTPRESLMIQMGLMGVEPNRDVVDALLRRVSLYDKRDAYTRTLSGGMKRRLLVAKALVHQPRLLFLDEPTAGVDVELRKELWQEVERLRDQGTTIILTTHYLEEAERLADRIGVLHRGRLRLVRERATLLREHARGMARLTLAEMPATWPEAIAARVQPVSADTVQIPCADAADLQQLLAAVLSVATVTDVQLQRASLEDIFVDLIHQADLEAAEAGR